MAEVSQNAAEREKEIFDAAPSLTPPTQHTDASGSPFSSATPVMLSSLPLGLPTLTEAIHLWDPKSFSEMIGCGPPLLRGWTSVHGSSLPRLPPENLIMGLGKPSRAGVGTFPVTGKLPF